MFLTTLTAYTCSNGGRSSLLGNPRRCITTSTCCTLLEGCLQERGNGFEAQSCLTPSPLCCAAPGRPPSPEGRRYLRNKVVESLQVPRGQESGNVELIDTSGLEATELVLDLGHTPGQHGISGAFLTESKAWHQATHQAFTVFRIVGNGHGHIRGVGDLDWITANGITVPGKHLAFVAQRLRTAPDIPVISVFGSNTQRASLTTAADQQFGMRLLQRLGKQGGFGELIILAVESRGGLGPEPEQHLTGFFKTVQAFSNRVVRNPIGGVLIALPGSTYTTDEVSTGHDVHCRGHFRDDGGMVIGIPGDEGADTQALGGQR